MLILNFISVQDFLEKAKKDFEEKWSKNPKVSWFNAKTGKQLTFCLGNKKSFYGFFLEDLFDTLIYIIHILTFLMRNIIIKKAHLNKHFPFLSH